MSLHGQKLSTAVQFDAAIPAQAEQNDIVCWLGNKLKAALQDAAESDSNRADCCCSWTVEEYGGS